MKLSNIGIDAVGSAMFKQVRLQFGNIPTHIVGREDARCIVVILH